RIIGEYGDLLHAPPGAKWRSWISPRYIPVRHWLPDFVEADPGAAYIHLVRRYLGAFGPATRADIAAWSGQSVGRLAPALAALEPELCAFTDERGRTLYDLASAPRPPAVTPVPARYLPKWDSLLLAHQDRTRVLPEPYRKTVIRVNGDVLPTFLIDGLVAGTWEVTRRGTEAVLRLAPSRTLRPADRRALEKEGERLLRFVEPDAASYAVHIA
ncbi:MAG: winged helix DNA-binding domain-containing protein, partial [Chloroflexota bacterium]